jgi:predicted restriction endonuclease
MTDAFAPQILRFAQDDNRIFRADYILRTKGRSVLRRYTSRCKICASAIEVTAWELGLVGARI